MADFWWRGSLCAQVGAEFWFPPDGDNGNDSKRVCERCPVRLLCLADAISNPEAIEHGIFGGFGRDIRRELQARVHAGEPALAVAQHAITRRYA